MEFPLKYLNGHIIVTVENEDWLVDTGSPMSFGNQAINLDGRPRQLSTGLMGINTEFLREHTELPLAGLLGTDILNDYDIVFDLPHGVIQISQELTMPQEDAIPIDLNLGVPVLNTQINSASMSCFFDTGAQISYAPAGILKPVDRIGPFQDFYPTQGAFEIELHWADLVLGNTAFKIRCGAMPDFLAAMMDITGVEGIIGNEIMRDHRVGYFPQRGMLVIA